jgi:hypothetical protein
MFVHMPYQITRHPEIQCSVLVASK